MNSIIIDKTKYEKLKKDNETLKKALTEILELAGPHNEDTVMAIVADVASDALAAIEKGENNEI